MVDELVVIGDDELGISLVELVAAGDKGNLDIEHKRDDVDHLFGAHRHELHVPGEQGGELALVSRFVHHFL